MGRRRNEGSGGGETSAATAIPPGAMEMVERVKKVVDLSDDKIYAALVECRMNPDEAIRLLMLQAEDASMELSLATSNLQQLSLYEEQDTVPTESCPAVIIPDHLQVTNVDCSSCLGTSGSGITGPSTGAFIPRPLKSNLELASDADTNMPSIGQPDSTISEDHLDERIRRFLDDSLFFITSTSTDNYGMLSTSQPEVIRNDTFVSPHTIQQNFPSSSGYAFSNTTQPTAEAYTYRQALSPAAHPAPSISSGSFLTRQLSPPFDSQPIHPSRRYLPSAAIRQSPAMLYGTGTRYMIRANVAPGHGVFWISPNIPGSYRGTPSTFSARRSVGYQGDRGSQFIGINHFQFPLQDTRTAAALWGSWGLGFRPMYFVTWYPGHYGSPEVFSEEYQQHLSASGNLDISQRPLSRWQRRY